MLSFSGILSPFRHKTSLGREHVLSDNIVEKTLEVCLNEAEVSGYEIISHGDTYLIALPRPGHDVQRDTDISPPAPKSLRQQLDDDVPY